MHPRSSAPAESVAVIANERNGMGRTKLSLLAASLLIVGVIGISGSSSARTTTFCGPLLVKHTPQVIRSHDLKCAPARRILKAELTGGQIPANWDCSASLKRCYKGGFGSDHWFSWAEATAS
jgi:hypothetical protein